MSNGSLTQTRELLHEVFSTPRYSSLGYLEWQYLLNPNGPQIEANEYIDAKLIAHYVVILQTYHSLNGTMKLALSCNTAVSPKAQGKGLFTKLAELTFKFAKELHHVDGIVGVANANSTPGFLGRLKFSFLAPLPVKIGIRPWRNTKRVSVHLVDDQFLTSNSFEKTASQIDFLPDRSGAWSQLYDADILKWRLASPIGRYTIFSSKSGALITTDELYRGIKITVILKIFKAKQSESVDVKELIGAACKTYGSWFYLYAGFNNTAVVRGLGLPRRLLPSPLNLIFRNLGTGLSSDFKLGTFEFLDFDAY